MTMQIIVSINRTRLMACGAGSVSVTPLPNMITTQLGARDKLRGLVEAGNALREEAVWIPTARRWDRAITKVKEEAR